MRSGRYRGVLRRNESLIELNMRLNRLTDEGGRMLLEGLRDNGSLQLLNLSSNSLAAETTRSFAGLLRNPYCALVAVDLSNNDINDTDVDTVHEVVQDNLSLTSLDLRNNRVSKGSDKGQHCKHYPGERAALGSDCLLRLHIQYTYQRIKKSFFFVPGLSSPVFALPHCTHRNIPISNVKALTVTLPSRLQNCSFTCM